MGEEGSAIPRFMMISVFIRDGRSALFPCTFDFVGDYCTLQCCTFFSCCFQASVRTRNLSIVPLRERQPVTVIMSRSGTCKKSGRATVCVGALKKFRADSIRGTKVANCVPCANVLRSSLVHHHHHHPLWSGIRACALSRQMLLARR